MVTLVPPLCFGNDKFWKGGVENLKLSEKKSIVEELHERLEKTAVVILTDYKGLNVKDVTVLRSELRKADVQYRVVKNTLLRKASENTDSFAIEKYFKGPSAIAFSYEDPVAPAKVLVKFAEDNKKLEIKVGVMNGKVIDQEQIKALASMPSREQLLGQVLSVMNAVPTSFVRVLNGVPGAFVNVLQALKDQKEAA